VNELPFDHSYIANLDSAEPVRFVDTIGGVARPLRDSSPLILNFHLPPAVL
jgi:hypothetical protein